MSSAIPYPQYKDYEGKQAEGLRRRSIYPLGSMIKSGGEGAVFNIVGQDDYVAKIYSYSSLSDPVISAKKRDKIRVMLDNPVNTKDETGRFLMIAWPVDSIQIGGRFVGYIMPRVRSTGNLDSITNESLCKRNHPNVTWRTKLCYAYNLAYAVQLVHNAGHIIGDMNPDNLLVNDQGIITIIDTDSFSVNDRYGNTYPCEVGVEEYLAPEIQFSGRIAGRKFTAYTDFFALSVNIFRLLMGGYHPFSLRVEACGKSVGQSPIQTYILEGICPFVNDYREYTVPPLAPTLGDMPPDISELFRKAFNYNAANVVQNARHRPNAQEWQNVLYYWYSRADNFSVCKKNRSHEYYSRLSACPWCEAEKRMQSISSSYSVQSNNTYATQSDGAPGTPSPVHSVGNQPTVQNQRGAYGQQSFRSQQAATGKWNSWLVIWTLITTFVLNALPTGIYSFYSLYKAAKATLYTEQKKYERRAIIGNIIGMVLFALLIVIIVLSY